MYCIFHSMMTGCEKLFHHLQIKVLFTDNSEHPTSYVHYSETLFSLK